MAKFYGYSDGNTNRGITLIESLIYIAVLSSILVMFANIVLSVNSSYGRLRAIRNMDIAAVTSMERMSREIKDSTDINLGQSVLGSSPGILSIDRNANGQSFNTKFQISGQNIQILINDVDAGTLLHPGMSATSLIFRRIDSGNSRGVRIEMTLSDTVESEVISQNYYMTAALRGSY